jgi:peptide/nickel transport system ATP-binding protein
MYAGNIIESGSVDEVFKKPTHPYTIGLLASVPTAKMKRGELQGLPGSVPNLLSPPSGCRFAPRCQFAQPRCTAAFPPSIAIAEHHEVACVLAETHASAAA